MSEGAAGAVSLLIELPFPSKVLWPNGRGHWRVVAKAKKAHKQWAWIATKVVLPPRDAADIANGSTVRLIYTVYPKDGNQPDEDNCVAAMKAYQDGVALALGVDDKTFRRPDILFGQPVKGGKVVLELKIGS